MTDTDFRLEEYRQLRAEIHDREAAIKKYVLFCIVTTVSILTASATIFYSKIADACSTSQLDVWFAVMFLSPLLILFPMAFLMVANRREIFFAATYLQVFYDHECLGTNWEIRIEKFYGATKRLHSFDYIPLTIFLLILTSCAAFFCALSVINRTYTFEVWHLILLVPFVFLIVFWIKFSEIPNQLRKKYLKQWRDVLAEERR